MRIVISDLIYVLVIITVLLTASFLLVPLKLDDTPVLGEFEADPVQTKKARIEYFFNLLRDPATNKIPAKIRAKELNYSKKLPTRSESGFRRKSGQTALATTEITWQSAGPADVGGRTRALGVDQDNPDILIAGGVSGGIWKSTDGGDSWEMKTNANQNMSVTSLTQDPSNHDVWYYASGEFLGNSASDRGSRAIYHGTGIYKSTNNGETWSIIPATQDNDNTFSTPFDYISRIKVSPATGSIFGASNGVGLLRSTDGGTTFPILKGGSNEYAWTDFDIDSNGNIAAVFSTTYLGDTDPNNDPGIFYSTNDGDEWSNITPPDFPGAHDRSVITFAPSDPTIVYVFTEKTESETNQGVSFFKIDITDPENPVADNRSANLPDFGDPVGGINLQGGYNMLVSVKPDDSDFVMLGATNLFRSRDAFETAVPDSNEVTTDSLKNEYWIGGYAKSNDVNLYEGQHPDQHIVVYDPTDPAKVWAGHDGGVSLTTDITAHSVTWTNKDNEYVTGQFYTVAIPSATDDYRIIGGTQDNGTPFFRLGNNNQQSVNAVDISSGDGSYAFWGDDYAYVSTQNGNILRLVIESSGDLTSPYDGSTSTQWSFVYPSHAVDKLFIHPYAIDPLNENIMYYPGGTVMWRNTQVDQIPDFNSGGTTQGWESFGSISETGYTITALETTTVPSGRLYYAASSNEEIPKFFRADNASSAENVTDINVMDISESDVPPGAYIHDIAVNPNNGDEAIFVMSNYNIVGLFHTTDAGSTWTPVEGNLEGDSQNPGPSLRSATIFPTSSGPIYFLGTSTGLYSTSTLSGSSTTWIRESDGSGPQDIGHSVSEYVTARPSDGTIAVATHGRGIFLGSIEVSGMDTTDTTPPAAPLALAVGSTGGDVQLTWEANTESDIDKYKIYRGEEIDSMVLYDSTASAFSNSYLDKDTAFKSYFYRITAVDINGNESGFSETSIAFRDKVEVNNQWSLIGMPLTSNDAATLPDNVEVFSFNGAYQVSEEFSSQNGFWVKSVTEDSIRFNGGALTETSVTLEAGWNLVSGIGDTIPASAISDPNNVLGSTPIFEYSGGSYNDNVTQINPTGGYWIYADQAGDIEMAIPESSSQSQKQLLAEINSVNEIEFRQGNHLQKFYLADGTISDDIRGTFRMPPISPDPALDVRTSGGFRLAEENISQLELTTAKFPVKVRLDAHSTSSYVLKGVTGQDTVLYNLSSGTEIEIQRPHQEFFIVNASIDQLITQNELLPNYPNPFNPTTKIEYRIASESFVTLAVYDILGRKVQTLVNEVQEPGVYTETFDARGLSSGTYFFRIKADNFNRVRQMTLIK